jgi:hypothetical protein
MSKATHVRWGRWIGAFAGALVLLKSLSFCLSRGVAIAKDEVRVRGSDASFVLDMVARRQGHHG